MKILSPKVAAILAFFLFLNSCKHEAILDELKEIATVIDTTNEGGNNGNNVPKDPCDPDSVYFINDILPILNSNCAFSGCHGDGSAQDGVDLTSYSSIISTSEIVPFNPNESKLYDAITEKDPGKIMPPPPANKLSSDQIAKIRTWIAQGALNNYCEGCDTATVSFSASIQPIIQNNCQGCHSGGSPSGGILLTNYDQIQAQALNGKLFGGINHENGFKPMPYNQNKLDQCKIDQIRIWIANGSLND